MAKQPYTKFAGILDDNGLITSTVRYLDKDTALEHAESEDKVIVFDSIGEWGFLVYLCQHAWDFGLHDVTFHPKYQVLKGETHYGKKINRRYTADMQFRLKGSKELFVIDVKGGRGSGHKMKAFFNGNQAPKVKQDMLSLQYNDRIFDFIPITHIKTTKQMTKRFTVNLPDTTCNHGVSLQALFASKVIRFTLPFPDCIVRKIPVLF